MAPRRGGPVRYEPEVAGKLKRLAEENGPWLWGRISVWQTGPWKRFSLRPELDHLERTMFRYPYRPWGGPAEGIRLVQAENPADEVDFVVNQIHRLVKKDGSATGDRHCLRGSAGV